LADWGRSTIFIHAAEAEQASFIAKDPTVFLKVSQVTDLDVDASGRMYIAAWAGAGWTGNAKRGYVVRVLPEGFVYKPFPKLSKVSDAKLLYHLASGSHTARVDAQQEILGRKATKLLSKIYELAQNNKLSLEARVAAVYTIAQLGELKALSALEKLSKLPELREHAIRCMADQKFMAVKANISLLTDAITDSNPRVQVAAVVALGRTGNKAAAASLLKVANRPALAITKPNDRSKNRKSHSTPQYDAILAHVSRQALIALDAQDATITALNSNSTHLQNAALFTMKYMHSEKVLQALIKRVKSTTDKTFQLNIVKTLIRLHQQEKTFDVDYKWWSTRPNPHGPYFYNVSWKGTETVDGFLKSYLPTLAKKDQDILNKEISRCQAKAKKTTKTVKKVKTVGQTSIEDLIIFVSRKKGKNYRKPNLAKGKKVINKVGCIGCHNIASGQIVKAPDLSKLGKVSSADIAMSIVKPAAAIAKTWVNITTKKGAIHTGTIVKKDATEIVLHNIAGLKTVIKVSDIKTTAPGTSMMLLHLCDNLNLQEFADLVEYIKSLDPNYKK
ncbi:MAG: HEAT repeat domain-containing protein, partial [Lentisphaeraceae bacterium]|nr:HEAT repeat domain-containing protein [Lentisphaeraceae bacterium]